MATAKKIPTSTKAKTAKAPTKTAPKKSAPSKASMTEKNKKTVTTLKAPQAKPQPPRATIPVARPSQAPTAPHLPVRLQAVVDKSEIAELIYTFARGLDRLDETLLRSVLHPDASVDLGPGVFQGTSNDYVHWALGVLTQTRESHHFIGNILTTLEGEAAFSESYCQTHYRLDKPTGREDVFVGSRFLDRLERRPSGPMGVWKIMHRKEVIDWVRTESVSDIFYHQNPDALWSYRTKTDLSYQMSQFPGSQPGSKMPSFLGRRYESKSIKF